MCSKILSHDIADTIISSSSNREKSELYECDAIPLDEWNDFLQ